MENKKDLLFAFAIYLVIAIVLFVVNIQPILPLLNN